MTGLDIPLKHAIRYEASSILRQHKNIHVLHGDYVYDPKTEAQLPIALMASTAKSIQTDPSKNWLWARVQQVIDIKELTEDNPLVILTDTNASINIIASPYNRLTAFSSTMLGAYVKSDQRLQELSLFTVPLAGASAGYGGVMGENDIDPLLNGIIYKTQLLKETSEKLMISGYNQGYLCEYYFPLLVVNDFLYEAVFDVAQRKIVTQKIDKIKIFWRGAIADNEAHSTISIIDVVTLKGLANYSEDLSGDTEKLLKIIFSCYDDVCKFEAHTP